MVKLDTPTAEKTGFIAKPGESRLAGVSVRGWIALIIICSACAESVFIVGSAASVAFHNGSVTPLSDPTVSLMFSGIKDLALIVLGYLFAKEEDHFKRKLK